MSCDMAAVGRIVSRKSLTATTCVEVAADGIRRVAVLVVKYLLLIVYVVLLVMITSDLEYTVVTSGKLMMEVTPLALIVRGLGLRLVVKAKSNEIILELTGTFQKLMIDVVTICKSAHSQLYSDGSTYLGGGSL
jgi:hypothetical protein